MEKEIEERDTHSGRRILTFLAGSAFGVGAGLLMSKACGALDRVGTTGRIKVSKRAPAETTPYCAVPEGADICYPE